MSTAPESRKLTAQEYLAIERASDTKHEFYRGEMTAMSGVRLPHLRIVRNLSHHLTAQFQDSPCEVFTNDLRVLVDPIGFYCYPDLVIVCGTPQLLDKEFDTLLNPVVILEVLSESTETYDRGEKFRRYRSIESLRTYILVSQTTMNVEWFIRNPPDADAAWSFDSASGPDGTLPITTLAVPVAIPLRDIYKGVEFPSQNPDA
jgi:Uma2 family endonuclease